MSVKLRERKKGKKISLYLDIYENGKREYEYLKMYLFPQPEKGRLTNEQKAHNEKTLAVANKIATDRGWQYFNDEHNILDKSRIKGSFVLYVEQLAKKREEVKGNHGNWLSAIKYLKAFHSDVLFSDIDKSWIENWKEYLEKKAKSTNGRTLSQNTKVSYYSKIIAAIKEAYREGIIKNKYTDLVKGIVPEEPRKQFLTAEELTLLVKSDCENPLLKKAFLFSCFTGLRWSDVSKLKWDDIQYSETNGYFIQLKQKKTDEEGTIQVGEQAIEVLGEKENEGKLIFDGLKYSAHTNTKLLLWVMNAGIKKKITFHCSRHTFATWLLSNDVDIYTVQKLLLHKNIKNTQVYAKIIDQKRKAAVDKLTLNLT
ncbi:tyrosine-type recombinase/integrase [Terrimonas alba]|uniref:tyrosine-type recombinase/integrase n=1 Tax=Terrimonas alba TaxID=3349636 RepID=UPI0035F2AA42